MASQMTFMEALGKPTSGDIDTFINVYLNISGVVIGVIFALSSVLGKYGHPELVQTIIYEKILCGMTVTIVFGSCYYAWMAVRLRQKTGQDVTALPYGINTPAAFAFIFNIIGTAALTSESEYCSTVDGVMTCSEEIIWNAWRVGCVANMVGGVVSTVCGFFGNDLAKLAPTPAMMVGIGGIGITYLGIAQLKLSFTAGFAGLLPLVTALLVFFGGLDTKPVPISIVVILIGSLAGWLSFQGWEGGGTSKAVANSFESLGFYFPSLLDSKSFGSIPGVLSENLGMILPVALTGAVGTLLCVHSAAEAGDNYSIREAMIVDGLTTMVAAAFGSPLGTCVYIGHPQYKAQNGKIYYSIFNSILFSIFAMTGLFGTVVAILPPYAIGPIILFVGIAINQDMFANCPTKHIPGVVLGLFPALADWIKSFWPFDRPLPPSIYALAMGALFVAFIWASLAIYIIDGNYKKAIGWAIAAAVFSAIGLIHQPTVDLTFKTFLEGGAPGAKTFDVSPCSFFIGYMSVAFMIAGALWLQIRGSDRVKQQELDEEVMKSQTNENSMIATSFVKRESVAARKVTGEGMNVELRSGSFTESTA